MRPFSIAAAAIEEQSCVLFSIAALLLRPFSIAAAAVEEETAILLLRPISAAVSSIAAAVTSFAAVSYIAALRLTFYI